MTAEIDVMTEIEDKTDPLPARLKWFNGPKGFGFVVLEHNNADAFLHITTLQRAGIQALGDGARLICHVDRGPKGAQVAEIVELLHAGEAPEPLQDDRPTGDTGPLIRLTGTVKWYKPDKGFGFVTADDGEKDIFLHKSCLDHHRLQAIEPGARIVMNVRIVARGREVVNFVFDRA